jgi:heme-degrading monooxygenase HmoA
MSTYYTAGRWIPRPDETEAFVEAWTEFAVWASGMPGAEELRLVREVGDGGHYLSFGVWDSDDAVHAWKSMPEFRPRLARVLAHVEAFEPSELALVATARAGAVSGAR